MDIYAQSEISISKMDTVNTINTLDDYRVKLKEIMDGAENVALAAWDFNNSDRMLQLVNLVLDKLKVEAWSELLKNLRGLPYIKLEGRIQNKRNDIRRIERTHERQFVAFSNLAPSDNLKKRNYEEVTNVLEMMSRCFKNVSIKYSN